MTSFSYFKVRMPGAICLLPPQQVKTKNPVIDRAASLIVSLLSGMPFFGLFST